MLKQNKTKQNHLECRRPKKQGFDPLVGKIPWRRAPQPTPVFLPGESHQQRGLAGYSPQDHKELGRTKATYHARKKYFYQKLLL